jgi:RNA polymerase sigma-B factor
MPMVRALARRYAGRGEPLEDLVQVGAIGLIKAIDRFDPSRGKELSALAAPTILGELRRHFRDRAWALHVPRALQENQARVARTLEELTARLGRSPSLGELERETGLPVETVLEALAAAGAYRPASLDAPPPGRSRDADWEPRAIAMSEEGFELALGRAALGDGVERLPARERIILHLRFEQGLSQSEIGQRIGISQMHVSRLIRRAIERLRQHAGA